MTLAPSAPEALPDISSGGVLNICKARGASSFLAVVIARRILGVKKVGHCGTLDPAASGVLLVVYGAATRQADALMLKEKVYRFRMKLGVKTDTGDLEGEVIERSEPQRLTKNQIEEAARKLTGRRDQVPPMYSALKWGGKKLYELAREGKVVERLPRTIEIFSLDLLSHGDAELEFRVRCSKGTYVRTLAEEIGVELGLPAAVSELVREKSGEFSIEESIPWERFQKMGREELLARATPVPAAAQ